MRSRRPLVLLLVALVALAGWLLLRGAGGKGGAGVVPRERVSAESPELLETPAEEGAPSLAGASNAEAAHAPLGTVGDVRVRVVGRGGVPLPDVPVWRIGEMGELAGIEFTDAQGEVAFAAVRYGGEAWIAAARLNDDHRLEPGVRHRVMGPTMLLRVDLGLPCEVVAVDAESGRTLEGVATTLVPRLTTPLAWRVPTRTGERLVLARPDTDVALALAVEVPEGYVLWANDEPYVEISRYATALRYVVPLHREADVVIDVLEHDGSPARDPYVSAWTLGGKEGESAGQAETESLASNRLRLRGVPYVEGSLLRVHVALEALEDDRNVEVAVRLGRPTLLVARLPASGQGIRDVPFQGPHPGTIGLGGSGDLPPPVPPEGRVELAAVLRDGTPAAGARVSFRYQEEGYALRAFPAVLDEGGRHENEIPEGTWRVQFYEPGLVQTGEPFEVRAGRTTRVRLREGAGGTLRLRVVGPDGRPLPFARVHVNDWMWRDMDAGVQRLDPYVDEMGARTLRHVSPGEFEVSAWYAGGTGTTEVTVVEGETVAVTVVVEPGE